jgi:WD40 repeat protein
MRQVAILPSGCQVHYKGSVLFFNEKRFCFASTLAVYVYNSKTFALEKVLSMNQRAITSISVSPHDDDLLAVSGLDGSLSLWKINEEKVIAKVSMSGSVTLTWNPFSVNHIAVLSNNPNFKFYHWSSFNTYFSLLSYIPFKE